MSKPLVMSSREHVLSGLANPYLVCDICKQKVPYWHNPERCCSDDFYNYPCGHQAGATSICPSWSPVDGCICKDKETHDKG